MTRRMYPFASLAEALRMTEAEASRHLGLSGSTDRKYRTEGLTEKVADRLAVRAGYHPFVIWPELADAVIAEVTERVCEECGEGFVPASRNHPRQRFCSKPCSQRRWSREAYQRSEDYRERKLASARRYYAECGEYVRAKNRQRKAA